MYGRVVIYSFDEDRDALEAKARASVIPLVTGTPGYLAYSVMFTEDRVISSSAWESEEHAKAGDAAPKSATTSAMHFFIPISSRKACRTERI